MIALVSVQYFYLLYLYMSTIHKLRRSSGRESTAERYVPHTNFRIFIRLGWVGDAQTESLPEWGVQEKWMARKFQGVSRAFREVLGGMPAEFYGSVIPWSVSGIFIEHHAVRKAAGGFWASQEFQVILIGFLGFLEALKGFMETS